jgi:hypothetical protein
VALSTVEVAFGGEPSPAASSAAAASECYRIGEGAGRTNAEAELVLDTRDLASALLGGVHCAEVF